MSLSENNFSSLFKSDDDFCNLNLDTFNNIYLCNVMAGRKLAVLGRGTSFEAVSFNPDVVTPAPAIWSKQILESQFFMRFTLKEVGTFF